MTVDDLFLKLADLRKRGFGAHHVAMEGGESERYVWPVESVVHVMGERVSNHYVLTTAGSLGLVVVSQLDEVP